MFVSVRNHVINFFGSNAYGNSLLRVYRQRQINQRSASTRLHSAIKTVCHGDFSVTVLPALSDNYMYLIKPYNTVESILVDPVDHRSASHRIIEEKSRLDTILCTHHHADHDSGNEPLKRLYPQVKVYGTDERVSGITNLIQHNDQRLVCGLNVLTIKTACHTLGHGCFIVKSSSGPNAVFVGDTLFHAGCGRFFEGTAKDMVASIDIINNSVREEDLMYFGHEYSKTNLEFALSVDGQNPAVQERAPEVLQLREGEVSTSPTSFALEYKVNPFLRLDEPAIRLATGECDRESVCRVLREMKDAF